MCSSSPFLLFCSVFLFLPLISAYYFVLTRYSPLKSASPLLSADYLFRPSVSTKETNLSPDREWTVGMSTLGEEGPFGGDKNWDKNRAKIERTEKRFAGSANTLPTQEHVCSTVIRTDHRPLFGREQNGTRVEIQQDENRQFSATFVECSNTKKGKCHGIDNAIFSSECVTLYEFRPAGVRAEGNTADFVEGFVRVPITCQCQLRRKKKHGIYSN